MLIKILKIVIHAEHDTIWNLLMDRLRNPQRYMSGVTEVRMLEDNGREMVREILQDDKIVREKITVNHYESEIRHEFLEHPSFSGQISSRIVRTSRQSPVAPQYLEYQIDLTPKSLIVEGVVKGEEAVVKVLEYEMQTLKQCAEKMETV